MPAAMEPAWYVSRVQDREITPGYRDFTSNDTRGAKANQWKPCLDGRNYKREQYPRVVENVTDNWAQKIKCRLQDLLKGVAAVGAFPNLEGDLADILGQGI